ncbi:MAG TPA: glycosyltransferase family 25 protein [Woeseiaceae bacterium]|nr:glycosyltransferase family 25 protein [Woeseiaceae bacterium]
MKIFVITLSDSVARQQHAAGQLQAEALAFSFFPAVPGAEAMRSPEYRVSERNFLLSTGRKVTPGEVGCFASHKLLWKLCVQLDEPILVMEDDFQLAAEFPGALRALESHVGECGFIRLQSERRARKRQVRTLGRFTLWRYTKAPNSAMCYGLSPLAARKLLAHADRIGAPVDVYMKRAWRHGQRMYGITPYTVSESALSEVTQIVGRAKARKSVTTRLSRTLARTREWLARVRFNRAPP